MISRIAPSDPLMVLGGLGNPSGYLLPEEHLVVAVRRQLMVLAAALAETLGFVLGAFMIQLLFGQVPFMGTVTVLIVLAAVVRFCYLILEWRVERFLITDQRMMLIGGVFTRQVAVMPMRKVTDLTFEKPLIGQIFGYGTFIVESAGQDQALSRIEFLPHANQMYLRVSDLLFGTAQASVDSIQPTTTPEPVAARPRYDDEDLLRADREPTDPDLGSKLASLDFNAPYPPRRTDDGDHPVLFGALQEHEPASHRMRERLGALNGRGRRREGSRPA